MSKGLIHYFVFYYRIDTIMDKTKENTRYTPEWSIYQDKEILAPLFKLFSLDLDKDSILGEEYDLRLSKAMKIIEKSSIYRYYWAFNEKKERKIPDLKLSQIQQLSEVPLEKDQDILDDVVESILNIPKTISIFAKDFLLFRTKRNKDKQKRKVTKEELIAYGECLAEVLDDFSRLADKRHKVSILHSESFVVCKIELSFSDLPIEVNYQWIEAEEDYQEEGEGIHRGVCIMDESMITLCKPAYILNWMKSQALSDARNILREVLPSIIS